MSTSTENTRKLFTAYASTEWKSSAKTLSSCYYVRSYTILFITIECSCSCNTCLNFINHKQNIIILTNFCCFPDKRLLQWINSALALNKLYKNSTNSIVNKITQAFYIICFSVFKTFSKWEKVVMKNILSSCGKSCNSSAVE